MAQAQSSKNGLHGSNDGTFEENFRRLQEVVQRLSEGNLALGEALSAFEEGMELAERCGNMLDEAELRVKQVSERAMRVGAVQAAELNEAMRAKPEPELVTFELERFETLVFEEPVDQGPANRSQSTASKESKPAAPPPTKQSSPPEAPRPLDELDPLFDEDD